MHGPWICIPQPLNDSGAALEIGFITPATDRTITPWLILVPTLSFLFSLMPNISLCSPLFLFITPHFLNVILFQSTSDKHIDFYKSNVCSYRSPLLVPFFFCFSFYFFYSFFFFSPQAWWYVQSGRERTVFILRLLISDCAEMTWKTKRLWKELRYSPSSQGFSWLIKDSCKAAWQLWQISCRQSE